jgi:general secretion pathway protein G
MNFSGLPVPFAPAWTAYQGRWILALYPQMVRVALDRLMDKQAKSILDNEGFANGWKLMPPNASSMNYVDAARGVRQLYSLALPISQALIAMGQGEGLTMDVAALPSLSAITRHVFPSVSAGSTTPEGYLVKSHGAVPGTLASLAQASVAGPLAVSIALPALARAREQAKRTVSMANLRGIGTAILTYAEQNKGKLPPDLQTLVDSGAISEKALISPVDDNPGEDGSYIYVGAGLRHTMEPGLIMAYEKTENYDGGMTNGVFLDGHVEFMTSERLDALLEKTKEASETPAEAEGEQESDEPDDETKKQLEEEEQEESGEAPRPAEKVAPRKNAGRSQSREAKLARSMISSSGPVAMAIDTFRLDVGRYPQQLTELTEKPKDEEDSKKWSGPYVREAKFLNDPWGKPIRYQSPGEKNETSYDLWSVGPDGKDGTEDDIEN